MQRTSTELIPLAPSKLVCTSMGTIVACTPTPTYRKADLPDSGCRNLLSQRAEALAGCQQCEAEHRQEGSTWENLGRLLNDVRACARRGAREVAGLMSQLCDAAESACRDLTSHMQREELQANFASSLVPATEP
jgi:hypothetical protein